MLSSVTLLVIPLQIIMELTYVLEHSCTLRDLLDNVVIEDGLDQDEERAMLGLDAQLLSFQVDSDIVNLVHSALFFGFGDDPVAKLIVAGISTTLSVLIVFITTKDK